MGKRSKPIPPYKVVINYPPVTRKKWIPPDKRPKPPPPGPKYVKPEGVSQKLNPSSLLKVWHKYTIYDKIGVLPGNFSQSHKRFSFMSNGHQGTCNVAIACVFAHLYSMAEWTSTYLDKILDLGDNLYHRSHTIGTNICLTDIPLDCIFKSFFLNQMKITINLDKNERKTHKVSTIALEEVKKSILEALDKFLLSSSSGILSFNNSHWALWHFDSAYYFFNPEDHDQFGNMWLGLNGLGNSILLRCKTIQDFVEYLIANTRERVQKFELIPCTIDRMVTINVVPPETFEDLHLMSVVEPPEEDEVVEAKSKQSVDVVAKGKGEEEEGENQPEETPVVPPELDEISPDLPEDAVLGKRPSWMGEGMKAVKAQCSESRIPPEKLKAENLSFYLEIKPNMHIIRASTCQTDPKFSKYKGKQSLGNALSALIMLRLYKSKVWIPKILDTILKYGDLIYHDAMASIPRSQPLQIRDFARKTTMEEHHFQPVIDEYGAIGKLQSEDDEVLDLHPALDSFLSDHDCCILLGPLVLAVWVEDGLFYMFDPNERDKDGKVVQKMMQLGSQVMVLDNTGVACVVRSKNLKDLVELYMKNLEQEQKLDYFCLSKVLVNDFEDVAAKWNKFEGIALGKWILRGNFSQSSRRFQDQSRNNQSSACAVLAIAFQDMKHVKDWTQDTVDELIITGDDYYKESLVHLRKNNKLVNRHLMLSELLASFPYKNWMINFLIDECVVNGMINAKADEDVLDLRKALEVFFQDNKTGVVTSHNISVAIWIKDGVYYNFDSHRRDDKGLITGYGTACVLRCVTLDDLALTLEANLSPEKQDLFTINRVKAEFMEMKDGIVQPNSPHYKTIEAGVAILRSNNSEISAKYKLNVGKQTVPMCLMALGFNRLRSSNLWTQHDLDEILDKGDELYIESVVQVDKEDELRVQVDDPEAGGDEEKPKEEATPVVEDSAKAKVEFVDQKGDSGKWQKKKEEVVIEVEEKQEDESLHDIFQDNADTPQITLDNVTKQFNIGINQITVEIVDRETANVNERLKLALQEYFEEEQTSNQEIMMQSEALTVAMWRDAKSFYMFDPKPRDEEGDVFGKEDWSEYVASARGLDYLSEYSAGEEELMSEYEKLPPGATVDATTTTVSSVTPRTGLGEEDEEVTTMGAGDASFMETDQDPDQEQEVGEEETSEGILRMKRSLTHWLEQQKLLGRGCTLMFSDLNDMIEHVLENIPPIPRREMDFSLKEIHLRNTPEVKEKYNPEDGDRNDAYAGNWYEFEEVDYGRWILRGSMDLRNKLFPPSNRGKQSLAMCLVALSCATIFEVRCFKSSSIDRILSYGDKLYTFVKRWKRDQMKGAADNELNDDELDWVLDNEQFGIEDMVRKICISEKRLLVDIVQEIVSGDINAPSDHADILDVLKGLQQFFVENQFGILEAKDLIVAIWKGAKVFYMFDPNNCGPNGVRSPHGTACITRYLNLELLVKVFLSNVGRYGKNTFYIHKITLVVDACERPRQPIVEEPPARRQLVGGFHKVLPGKAILRGTMSQEHPSFNKSGGVMVAPIAIVALTMSLVHKTETWSKPIVDEILTLGEELYEETLNELGYDFNPWEDAMDVYRVKNDYKLGVVKANCELRHMDQRGVLDIKDPKIQNLRKGIEKFFEENTHGVLCSEPLTLALWEEQSSETGEPLIYMYDPYPRGPVGMPLMNGTACCMSFVNSKLTADHILGCVMEPDKKSCEYTIVPVEIVVGGCSCTKKKIQPAKTVTDVGELPRCKKSVVSEEKKKLRKIAEEERKRKEARKLFLIGRLEYHVINSEEAIIRGMRSQSSNRYSEGSRGHQDIPNCIVALVMHRILPMTHWNHNHIDLVLDTGDQLYIDSYIAYNPKNIKLGFQNVVRKVFLHDMEMHVTIYKPIISRLFNVNEVFNVMSSYFQQEESCIINYLEQWVAVVFKGGYYYVFDSHDRDREGHAVPFGLGWAMVMRFENVWALSVSLINNLTVNYNASIREFTVWLINICAKECCYAIKCP